VVVEVFEMCLRRVEGRVVVEVEGESWSGDRWRGLEWRWMDGEG